MADRRADAPDSAGRGHGARNLSARRRRDRAARAARAQRQRQGHGFRRGAGVADDSCRLVAATAVAAPRGPGGRPGDRPLRGPFPEAGQRRFPGALRLAGCRSHRGVHRAGTDQGPRQAGAGAGMPDRFRGGGHARGPVCCAGKARRRAGVGRMMHRSTVMRQSRAVLVIGVVSLLGLLGACGTLDEKDKKRTETMDRYEAVVRWNQFDSMVDFMHPDWLAENPVTSLEVERLHQFRVSQYTVRQVLSDSEGGVDRLVQLRLYNKHTAREKVVEYVESWRWDDERARWMLHSGLPDVTGRF